MLGQSFAPLGDPMQQQRPSGPGGPGGAQEAIKILNLRMPRVAGAGAPAPQALLEGAGSAGLPQQQNNPVINAILAAVLGHFQPQLQAAPTAMGGFMSQAPQGSQAPTSPKYDPVIRYQDDPNAKGAPVPGGTAGPGPGVPPPVRDRTPPVPPSKIAPFDGARARR